MMRDIFAHTKNIYSPTEKSFLAAIKHKIVI